MSCKITRHLDFCYAHRLPEYQGKCRFLHGHNGHVEITVASDSLGEDGMVLDFGKIRSGLEAWIDEELDHHTILFRKDPLVKVLQKAGQKVVVMDVIPTSENIAEMICRQGRAMGVNVTRVALWETARNCAEYLAED